MNVQSRCCAKSDFFLCVKLAMSLVGKGSHSGGASNHLAQIMEEMWRLCEEVKASQKEASWKMQRLARSARRDPYSFRRKGNKNQFRFNEDVEEQLADVRTHLQKVDAAKLGTRGATALEKAKEAATAGTELISRRQKLLKLADRSELGWAVVEEYIDDDLAEDSEDQKRIERVERAVERSHEEKESGEDKRQGRSSCRATGCYAERFRLSSRGAEANCNGYWDAPGDALVPFYLPTNSSSVEVRQFSLSPVKRIERVCTAQIKTFPLCHLLKAL